MRVKMKVALSGSRNGQSWPGVGGEIDLPDNEAADLCAAEMAEPVATDTVETAVPPDPEKRTDQDDPEALKTQLEGLGVKVDKRWGADRLREELDKAQKGSSSEPRS